jgi:hypothetical protein
MQRTRCGCIGSASMMLSVPSPARSVAISMSAAMLGSPARRATVAPILVVVARDDPGFVITVFLRN